jgi:hypothetical protein
MTDVQDDTPSTMSPQEKALKRKEQKATYQRLYYENNKARLSEHRGKKYVCSLCRGHYTHTHITTHLKTEKHMKAVKLQAQLTNLSPDLVANLISRVLGQPESSLKELIISIYNHETQGSPPQQEEQEEAEASKDQSEA